MSKNIASVRTEGIISDYPIRPYSVRDVQLTDRFWRPRLEINRTVTIPAVFERCETAGRVDNFRKAAGLLAGSYVGEMPFNDTDVYKAIEGASYSLVVHHDPALEAYVEQLAQVIASAQEPDGYLYTTRTIDPSNVHPLAGPTRWSSLLMSHELYNCGHLYEAACAHFVATGSRTLLDVALRSASLIKQVFGPGGLDDVPGHQIIEMGLARLFRVSGDRSCLEMARRFLEGRGRHHGREQYTYADDPGYCQDHMPVRQQREAVGHAVREAYMCCGTADVAALWPDPEYADAVTCIWQDLVRSKIYLTGGIGSRHSGESFGEPFELPNLTAYCETCASIALVMLNHRLFLLTGEARYYDVLEQTLYNALLAGISLQGTEFFYINPLESDGKFPFNHGSAGRQPWFGVSCCPTNLSRLFPSLPGYFYAQAEDRLYVNLYAAGTATLDHGGTPITVVQETEYPWNGRVRLRLAMPERADAFPLRLRLRIPSWSEGRIMDGPLYHFEKPRRETLAFHLNGAAYPILMEAGYAAIDRDFRDGDVVEIDLPMNPRKVMCDPAVVENRGRVAIQRGPLVYCVEERDTDGRLDELAIGDESELTGRFDPHLLGGITVVEGPGFRAVPYYAWGNRGPGAMKVWIANRERKAR